MADITKWFWVTIKEYLSYILAKFEDLVPLKNPKNEGFMKKSRCHCKGASIYDVRTEGGGGLAQKKM